MNDSQNKINTSVFRELLHQEWMTAENKERQVAEVLHTEPAQLLTVLKMHLSLLQTNYEKAPASSEPQNIADTLQKMDELIDQTAAVIRSVVTELRTDVLDNFGLTAALQREIDDYNDNPATRIECNLPDTSGTGSLRADRILFQAFSATLEYVGQLENVEALIVEIDDAEDLFEISLSMDGEANESTFDALLSNDIWKAKWGERLRSMQGEFGLRKKSNTRVEVTFKAPKRDNDNKIS